MEAGVDLILSETGKGSKICVYGDYDADGMTLHCADDDDAFSSYITGKICHTTYHPGLKRDMA